MRLCVNVDYILLIIDFFVNYELCTPAASAAVHVSSPTTTTNSIELLTAGIATGNNNFAIEIKVESPEFILFENQYELRKSNSFKIDVSDTKQVLIRHFKINHSFVLLFVCL